MGHMSQFFKLRDNNYPIKNYTEVSKSFDVSLGVKKQLAQKTAAAKQLAHETGAAKQVDPIY